MLNDINLILADSKEKIKEIPSKSIDVIITDPPYGIAFAKYDDTNKVLFDLEEDLYRVLKDDSWLIIWWSNKRLPEIFNLKLFTYKWLICCHFPHSSSNTPVGIRTFTPILAFMKGDAKRIQPRRDMVFACELPVIKKFGAGDFKPTFALSELVQIFSKEGDTILDPFMGYGGLGLVCKLFNRKFIGIEKDKIRFSVANKIISDGKLEKTIPEMENDFMEKYW